MVISCFVCVPVAFHIVEGVLAFEVLCHLPMQMHGQLGHQIEFT
jgi:hypothetical protein